MASESEEGYSLVRLLNGPLRELSKIRVYDIVFSRSCINRNVCDCESGGGNGRGGEEWLKTYTSGRMVCPCSPSWWLSTGIFFVGF